jgi:Fuc2NAc and GlcNAc transferase
VSALAVPLVLAGTFAVSAGLTAAVRGYAAARLVDVPNERSSHARATPRGGGIAMVIAFLAGLAACYRLGAVSPRMALALAPGTLAVAAVGWLDDHGHVAARWRSLVHFAAAAWALAWLGGLPQLEVGGARLALGAGGWLIGALGVVWVTNLYNFMDGIDGLAGLEALSAAGLGALLLGARGTPALVPLAGLLAAAAAGFLLWNWQPARIFMGDVGSGTLGYLFAVLAVASENQRALPLLAWVILTGAFVFDATATLLRRLARRERLYQAHRSHAYQRAVRAGWSHAAVSLGVLLLNLLLGGLVLVTLRVPTLLLPAFGAALLLLGGVYYGIERVQPMQPAGEAPALEPAGRPR